MRHNNTHVFPKISILISALICALFLGLVIGYRTGLADVAPPKAPPGANPEVDTVETNVRMMDEKVVIEVEKETDIKKMGTARVWAEFHMKNLGTTSERLMVRFPISYDDGFGGYPEIEDMYVYVDNAIVQTSKVKLEGEPEDWEDPIKWVEFEVIFPPNIMVEIEVEYTLNGTGEYPFVSYGYLLETGAGWQGTIGRAEIIVKLPYKASAQTVFIDASPGWGGTTPGARLSDDEVIWIFEDFEPGYKHNISIALVWPSAWYAVEKESKNVWDFPTDGESWGRLAKLYKDLSHDNRSTRIDPGGQQLVNLSRDAYLKALELLPDDALWHAGYADLLVWNSFFNYYNSAEARSEFIEALRQMQIAYSLDPEQPFILEYLERYTFPREAVDQVGGEYVFYWLTQTPTLMPEVGATLEPAPTQLVLYTATPEPAEVQPEQPGVEEAEQANEGGRKISLPICGSIILFPLVLGLVVAVPGIRRRTQ